MQTKIEIETETKIETSETETQSLQTVKDTVIERQRKRQS